MNFFLKRWLSDSASAHVPTRPRKLSIENLEDRTVPAIVIPDVADAQGPVRVGAASTITGNGFDPQTVLNPTDPNQVVTVFTRAAGAGTALGFQVSTDRGQSWAAQFPTVNVLSDPLTANFGFDPFIALDSPSAAYDRNGNLYVAYIQRNAANTSGALVLDKFTVDAFGNVAHVGNQQVLYRWANQDPIFNPVVGVNNLLPSFTDPVTGQVSTNSGAGRGVYVAWNTSATQTGFGDAQNRYLSPSVIMVAVSDDGAASFSTPQFVTDNGFQVGSPATVRNTAVDPQIYFTHNSVTNAIQGGLLGITWLGGTTNVGTAASVTASALGTDVSDPLPVPANPLTVQQTVTNNGGGVGGAFTPTGGVLTRAVTTFTQAVNVNAANFTTLADLNVTISLFSQDLSQMSVTLTSSTGVTITLLNARQQLDGAGALFTVNYGDGSTPGLPGGGVGGLGEQVFPTGGGGYSHRKTGLVFDQQAARVVNDPANLAPYILSLRPETFQSVGGRVGLNRFNGLTAAQLSGTWTLTVTNYKATDVNTSGPQLDQWDMKFVSRVNTTGFGADTTGQFTGAVSTATNTGTLTTASPTSGVQGWYSIAVDATLGAFSPFQGRVYATYTGGGGNDTDIFVRHSDDGGANWSARTRVNDDFSSTDFAEDNRAQFQPTVAVDPTTGTVVVMWYDARWDASNARAATFIATSVDGGDTFSPNTYLNLTKTALDAIDRTTVKIEPVPNNLATLTRGFGHNQGLVAYGGAVVPVWTGNANVAGSSTLMTAVAAIAGGPRVLQGDMGPVTDEFTSPGVGATTYNNVFSVDGTRQLNAFYVRFDRRVDPATFTAADVQLRYRDTTGAAAVDISNQVLSVTPLDADIYGAARFLIRLVPQTRVGTYSYAVGPAVSDRVRHDGLLGNAMDQDANGTPGQATDAFANPTPTGGVPFTLPYATDSLPLIIPGPRVAATAPGLTKDGAASYLDVTFDRDMLASSFTPAQVLELRTPFGTSLLGPFTVTANPPGTPPGVANRTFRVTFPPQALSGYYSLLLGSGIKSATGLAMDPNLNAGVELVTGRVTNPAVAGTVSNDYNTGTINVAVPPAASAGTPSVTTTSIVIADPFFITQQLGTPIQLRLSIAFPDTRDLSARLIGPDGTVIQLFTGPGRDLPPFADFTNTVFNDFAPTANLISNQGAPFSGGPYLPQQQLSVFNGKLSAGTWRLEVSNKSTTRSGRIVNWGLSLPQPVLGSGLGEPVTDTTTLGFRVYTANPNQVTATTNWTPLGPTLNADAGTGEQTNGVVTVTAVDPSDPSGNTVYAGSAHGGLWKTSNFLTRDAAGPTWIPLLDGASAKALRISSIAVIPRNNDPTQQSIVIVGTGDADTRTAGVGFLRSTDGGRTFRLINSTNNADAQTTIYPIDSPLRDNLFSANNSYVYKVVVDQVRQTNGEFYMYAAVGGDAAVAGLWRSVNSGRSWVRQRAGECTDIVLAENRVDIDPATGNPRLRNADAAYAAFAGVGGGVFFTQNITGGTPVLLNLLTGGVGKPLFSNGTFTFAVGNAGTNPNQGPTRVLLAAVHAPAANDPNATRIYQGYLYALVIGGGAPGLYMTKDFGANWVLIHTQVTTSVGLDGTLFPNTTLTNDETEPLFDLAVTPVTGLPRWNSLVADPTDPNVVYVGGSTMLTTANGTQLFPLNAAGTVRFGDAGVFRIDVSTLNDAHAQVGRDNSAGGVGAQAEAASTGGLTRGPSRVVFDPATGLPANNSAYFNRLRDPNNPFVTGATQILSTRNFDANGNEIPPVFLNNGFNAQVSRFRGVSGDALVRNLETVFDPLTRKTRLLVSTERGVFTAVDGADPLPTQGIYANATAVAAIGSATVVSGNRSSNLALADVTQTALQPSQLAADLAGLYNRVLRDPFGAPLPPAEQNSVGGQWVYAVTDQAYLNAPGGILAPANADYGKDQWRGEVHTDAYLSYAGIQAWKYAGHVETDPQGTGTIYQYRPAPFALTAGGAEVDQLGNSTDIFSVTIPGQAPIGRSNGLFNVGLGDTATAGIWATTVSASFAVNPGDNQGVVISAPIGGKVFLTTDQGLNWFNINGVTTFNNSPGTALAFGGKDPARGVDDFIYNGTAEGKIWVTRNAGGNWTDISAGLPTGAAAGPILKIIPNPRGNTYEAYAITATGVFYKADASTAAAWVNVTGNLFTLARPVFGEATTAFLLTRLSALEVDWRYQVPVLYAGGDSGVFRSTNHGTTWALFPAMANGATADGGYLPTVEVTDLDLVYGNLNATGVPDQSTARNVLVASTYGRGLYAIRLDPSAVPAGLGTSGPWVNTAPLTPPAAVDGLASITVTFGDAATPVRLDPATLNPTNMAIVGPGNVSVPFTVTDISGIVVGSVSGESLANVFRLDFTPPTAGTYQLLMNTGIRDTSGRQMNQNRDGTNGQQPQDYYIQTYAIAVNQPPTIGTVQSQGLVVNASSGALAFAVGDAETPAGSLAVTAATSNATVLPLADIVLGGSGADRTVTVTPRAAGTATVTLTVTDGGGRQTTTTFLVAATATPVLPFADNFDRPDAGDLGGSWLIRSGTVVGSFNSTLGTSPLAVATVNGVTQLNSAAQATVSLASSGSDSSSSLVARYTGAAAAATAFIGGVVLEGGVVTARIVRQVNGVATEVVRSTALPVAPQYVLRFEVVNESLKLFVNGTLVAFAYDPTAALAGAGATGIRITSGNRLDDYTDADITLLPVALPAVPGQTATDTFTQADGTQLSRNWRDRAGVLSVTGNILVSQAALNVSTLNVPAATANEGAQVDVGLTAAGQSVGIALRYSGSVAAPDTNMYWGSLTNLGNNQQLAAIWRNVNGVWTQLTATVLGFTGGVLRFEANGPSLKLFVNDARVLSATDTQLTAGVVGLRSNQGGLADNFFAFALGTTATLPFSDPFNSSAPRNQLASTWTEQSGAYSVASGAATALASSLNTGTGNTAVLSGVSAADVTVAATVKPQVGGLLSTGLVARYSGSGDAGSPTATFYWGALNVFGGQPFTQYSAQIWKVVNGVATNLNFNAVPIDPANAVNKELRFEVVGSSLKLFLNNQIVSFAFDTSIAAAGSVGLRTDAGAVLDDFTAAVKPAVTPTLPFTDPFASGLNPQNSLANTWQERLGVFSVATNQAVALDASTADIATLNGINIGDATIDGTFFFTASGQVGGLVGRYQGTNGTGDSNTYLATVVTLSGGDLQLLLMKNVGGNYTVLGNKVLSGYFAGGNFAATQPLLRFRLLGTQVTLFVDGTQQLTAADSSLATGSVGIRQTQGVGVDNFGVTSP